jgi:hypothetical protein
LSTKVCQILKSLIVHFMFFKMVLWQNGYA